MWSLREGLIHGSLWRRFYSLPVSSQFPSELFLENDKRQLFTSNLCVIIIFGKRQAEALHEQLVRYYFGKRQAAVSSWTTYMLSTLLKTASGSLLMDNLYIINTSKKNSKQQSLHGQLACYQHFLKTASGSFFMSTLYVSIFGRQQVAAYLFEQLVCYCYLENDKWQLLYKQFVGFWQRVADSSWAACVL